MSTKPAISFALSIVTSASLMMSQQVLAESVKQLPATKHQAESLKDVQATDTTVSPPTAGGMPMTDHQGEALSEVQQPGARGLGLLLAGGQEVPAVTTSASGRGSITINADKTVSGGISTSGIEATAAHSHSSRVRIRKLPGTIAALRKSRTEKTT